MEHIYIAREEWIIILSCVDFSKLCHVIKYFPWLNKVFRQEHITFPLSSISRAIEWRNKYPIELESYVDQIDTRLYHDFTIIKIYFNNDFVHNLWKDTRDTRDELFRKKYIQFRSIFIPLCSEPHDR